MHPRVSRLATSASSDGLILKDLPRVYAPFTKFTDEDMVAPDHAQRLEKRNVYCVWHFGDDGVGHPETVHGGCIAMAFDESFGHAFMSCEAQTPARPSSLSYLRFSPPSYNVCTTHTASPAAKAEVQTIMRLLGQFNHVTYGDRLVCAMNTVHVILFVLGVPRSDPEPRQQWTGVLASLPFSTSTTVDLFLLAIPFSFLSRWRNSRDERSL